MPTPTPIRVPNPRGEMIEPPSVSASDAKNGFGRILERVAREGGVTITRRHEPVAVVIPIETYRRLAGAEAGLLDSLTAEFDAVLARMQAPGVTEAMQSAFEMAAEELGATAVAAAAGGPPAALEPSSSNHGEHAPAPRRRARRG